MVRVQVQLLLTFTLGTYGVLTTDEIGNCTLNFNVLDCSNLSYYSVPKIGSITLNTSLIFNLSHNYISIDTGGEFDFMFSWPNRYIYVSELYLDHNKIRYLPPESLSAFTSTEVMDFSWNRMENISEKLFFGMEHLKRLSFAGNPIHELNIGLPPSLQQLDLSSCGLSSLGQQTFKGLHLDSLDISNNSLTAAADWSLADSAATSVLKDDNPWDCSLLWQYKPQFAALQGRCTTTTAPATMPAPATTTTVVVPERPLEGSTTTERPRQPPKELLWSSFGIVEGVLVGWLVYFMLLGSVAWLRARSLERDLARDGNWWLEPRL